MNLFKTLSIIILSLLLLFSGCSKTGIPTKVTPEMEEIIIQAILDNNKSDSLEGECPAEGHIIFGAETKKDIIYVYTYISYANYGFENSNFVDVSGGSNPAVFEFSADDYKLIKISYPQDGELYGASVKKLFPLKYRSRVFDLRDSDYENLNNQIKKYAAEYLESINRKAPVGTMRDFASAYPLLTDLGVSVEVSDILAEELEKYIVGYPYPYWVGSREQMENGKRYVYDLSCDKENHLIIYSKYEYDNPENIVEKITVHSLTGKRV